MHCPGISTCFIGNFITSGGGGANGPWGWSIDLENVMFSDGGTLSCDVYAGAGQCEFETKGSRVGSFIISENAVVWDLDQGVGLQNAHLYVGQCGANDGGNHLTSGVCSEDDMDKFARTPGQYSLVAPSGDDFDPPLAGFSFVDSNDEGSFRKGKWATANYQAFPLSQTDRRFMSAHATVCSCSSLPEGCALPPVEAQANLDGGSGSSGPSTKASYIGGITALAVAAALVVAIVVKHKMTRNRSTSSMSTGSDLYPGADLVDVPLNGASSELPPYPQLVI